SHLVIPAKAGIQGQQARSKRLWIPAFAGTTQRVVALEQGMRSPCRDASQRPGYEGGWRAEKRKILMARALSARGRLAARQSRTSPAAGLALVRSARANASAEPSASSWQGLLVAPGGAPLPPGCLVATRPAGAAPCPAFATPRESAP